MGFKNIQIGNIKLRQKFRKQRKGIEKPLNKNYYVPNKNI
jgi:hypothetical protein